MKHLPDINNVELNDILIPSFDHKRAEDDDCGLPENPIFSNYSKHLWKGHSENRRIRNDTSFPENTDGDRNHIK